MHYSWGHSRSNFSWTIGSLHDPVTWYGINYAGTQITQWDFQNKGKSGRTGKSSFVLKVTLRYLRSTIIYSVPCDRIVQRTYSSKGKKRSEVHPMCSYMKHQPVRQGQIRKPGIPGPTLFDKCVGSLTSSDNHVTLKMWNIVIVREEATSNHLQI